MAIPDYQTLMLPLLKQAAVSDVSVPEIRDSIANKFELTSEEREQLLKSGTQRVIDNRLHWARIYLAKAGLLINPKRGRFVATELGKALLAQNLPRIDNSVLSQYPSFVEFVSGRASSSEENVNNQKSAIVTVQADETPEEQIDSAFNALQAALRSDLIQRVLQNSPTFFEKVIVDLLVAMGYGGSRSDAATQLGGSSDGGVDGVINEDPLGLDRVYVQAKRYSEKNNVGRPEVQAFVGSLVGLGASKGVFVTTSEFSTQAKDFVQRLPQRIVLIGGKQLADLMIEHEVGVRTNRKLAFKRIDEDFFSDEV
jgi:restriction system protein